MVLIFCSGFAPETLKQKVAHVIRSAIRAYITCDLRVLMFYMLLVEVCTSIKQFNLCIYDI